MTISTTTLQIQETIRDQGKLVLSLNHNQTQSTLREQKSATNEIRTSKLTPVARP